MNTSEIHVGKTYCSRGKKKAIRTVLTIMGNLVKFLEQSGRSNGGKIGVAFKVDFAMWADGEIEKLK